MAVSLQTYTNNQVFSCDIGDYTISGLTASTAYTITVSNLIPITITILTLKLVSDASGVITIYNLQEVVENLFRRTPYTDGQLKIAIGDDNYTFKVYYASHKRFADIADYVGYNFALTKRYFTVPKNGYFQITLLSSGTPTVKATYLDLDTGEVAISTHALSSASLSHANISPSIISGILTADNIHHQLFSYSVFSGTHCVTVYVGHEQATHRLLFRNNYNAWQCLNLTAGTKRSVDKKKSEAICNGITSYYDVSDKYQVNLNAFIPHYLNEEVDELLQSLDVRLIPPTATLNAAGLIPADDCPKVLISSHTFDYSDEGGDPQTLELKLEFADPMESQKALINPDGIFTTTYDTTYS